MILLFKKDDNDNLAHNKPISSFNSRYKQLTAILQQRIADVLDKRLQRTQYGFGNKEAPHKQYVMSDAPWKKVKAQ